MGSPVTISGFNGIDFGGLLNAVMTQESQPLRRLETQQSDLKGQDSILAGLVSKLGAVEDAATALAEVDSLQILTATSSDETAVTASAGDGTATGTYDVVVTELARAQVTASTSSAAATTTVVASGGTLTITPAVGTAVTVTLAADTTLEGMADAINATAGTPVRAAIVRSAPAEYRLVLTAIDTGADNAFTVTNALTGGAGLAFADTDSDGVSGDSAADNAVTAIDASLTVNNIAITSASNVLNEAIPGVSLTLREKNAANTVRVEVTRDTTAAKEKVNEFVTAFNSVLTFFTDQRTAQVAGKNSVSRDPLVRGLHTAIRSALFDTYAGGSLTRLAEVGLAMTASGKIELDEGVFDGAVDADPDAVQTLFAGTGAAGAFGAIHALMQDYTQAGGLVATTRDRMKERVSSLTRQIDAMSVRLEQQRLTLQREYSAADQAMTRLKNQQASLSTLTSAF